MPTMPGGGQAGELPLPEYPRPQLVRDSYLNLNGRWRYAVTRSTRQPVGWDGEILVPFSPESALSGVGRTVMPDEFLWYERTFTLPEGFCRGRVLLHFGAVDQSCIIYINGEAAGRHIGGFLPFTIDITDYIKGEVQYLTVMANDESDAAPFSRGRQKLAPGGEYHRSQSGIWQTVWLESVPENYIKTLRITPLYDSHMVEVFFETEGGPLEGEVEIYARRTLTAKARVKSGEASLISMSGAISWRPDHPFLYTLRLTAGEDAAGSYFGMRSFTRERDDAGRPRFMLNGRPFFCAGVVDQGYYSDSMLTPPSDEAMIADIRFAKACGFNTIRKHGKFEPQRWYYHCDRLGIIVWQDLPAGGRETGAPLAAKLLPGRRLSDRHHRRFGREDAEGRAAFVQELEEALGTFSNTPSLAVWGLFQQGRGQFDAAALASLTRKMDRQRLVDHAAGCYDQGAGDVQSLYCTGDEVTLPEKQDERLLAVTLAGGFGLVPQHFCGTRPCAAEIFKSRQELGEAIVALYQQLAPLADKGLSAFFYTQLTDAEDEVSGLLSCDRMEQKLFPKGLATLNRLLAAPEDG